MGKIYSALKRSDHIFDQQDFSRIALSKKAQLTFLEKRALRRANISFKQKDLSKRALNEKVQFYS